MDDETILAPLIGEPVSAVAFVTDYVELHFNGPIFRCIADPTVTCGLSQFTFPEPGFRDAICSLIGERPVEVEVIDDVRITLRFARGCTLSVPLDADSARGGESAHFVGGRNEPVQVW